jgi:hypothetical protein
MICCYHNIFSCECLSDDRNERLSTDFSVQTVLIISQKTKPPGAVGVSIALEKFLPNNPSSDVGLPRLHNSSYTFYTVLPLLMGQWDIFGHFFLLQD